MCDLAAIYLVTSQTNQHLHAIYNCYKNRLRLSWENRVSQVHLQIYLVMRMLTKPLSV